MAGGSASACQTKVLPLRKEEEDELTGLLAMDACDEDDVVFEADWHIDESRYAITGDRDNNMI